MKKKVTLKIILILISTDILETLIHFCFKKGALSAGAISVENIQGLALFLKVVAYSPFLWTGLVSVVLVFIIWSTVLSKIDLSVAVPIASFSYILVPLVSIIFLHEKISLLRWSGIFLILLGVIFVSLSSKEKEGCLE